MRKHIYVAFSLLSVSLMAPAAHAGRGSSTSAIVSAIASNNPDAIISELERAERLVCGACIEPVMGLLDHDDYRVREAAAWWFARRPALKAEVQDLSVARLYGSDAIAARNAADALGTFRHPDGIPALAYAASRTDFPAATRAAAVRALGTIGMVAGKDAIVAALSDADGAVRAEAVTAYANLRGVSGDELAPLVSDGDVTVRRLATAKVGALATVSARAQLEQVLASDADALVRRNAAWSLGRIGDPASRTALQAAADGDTSSIVRSVADAAITMLR